MRKTRAEPIKVRGREITGFNWSGLINAGERIGDDLKQTKVGKTDDNVMSASVRRNEPIPLDTDNARVFVSPYQRHRDAIVGDTRYISGSRPTRNSDQQQPVGARNGV
jgi:hypothetical protein